MRVELEDVVPARGSLRGVSLTVREGEVTALVFLNQGTTSTRFMVFDAGGSEIARRQIEHRQILPSPGWVEHDPIEIAARVDEVIAGALRTAGLMR